MWSAQEKREADRFISADDKSTINFGPGSLWMVATRLRGSGDAPAATATLTATFKVQRRPRDPPALKSEAASTSNAPPPAIEKTSKFKPRALHKVPQYLPSVVDGHVPRGASILIIQRPWIDLILDGYKTLEIRGRHCKKENERIYLALSGGGGIVLGSVTFVTCHGPLTRSDWSARGESHCVAGEALPYGSSTFAWELAKPARFKAPVPYLHKPGVVVWAIKE